MNLAQILSEMSEQQQEQPKTELQKASIASLLLERFDQLEVKHEFKPGQLVQWKPNFKHKKSDGPLLVTKILDAPVTNKESDPGTCYYGEVFDIVLARIDHDGDFVENMYDSRRMEPYTGPTAETI